MTIQENISLQDKHTFRLDVRAKVWAEYSSVEELQTLLERYHDERLLPIGAGSNMLFTQDFDGVLLHSAMRRAKALDETKDYVDIEAESGLVLDSLIEQLVDMGLGGLENLSHIPGEVGASAIQNVGAYGVEAKDVIIRVKTIEIATGHARVFERDECEYAYRDSIFKGRLRGQYIITSVVYRLQKDPTLHLDYGPLSTLQPQSLHEVREAIIRIRQQKLPEVSELGSAGSFFKNPIVSEAHFETLQKSYPTMPYFVQKGGVKIPAAWLIEQCGWKGKQVGGAQVYDNQPLVIVNANHATAQDIVALAEQIQQSVQERFGITILPEVNYI